MEEYIAFDKHKRWVEHQQANNRASRCSSSSRAFFP
jgi:hypothetical protein